MAHVNGMFEELHQDSQDFGSDDQHMVSRVFFTIAVNGRPVLDDTNGSMRFHADVKLAVGGDYLRDHLEVGRPASYRGPWHHVAFAAAVTRYCRSCIGPGARGISIGPGCQVRMQDNRFGMRMPFEFDVPDIAGNTW